MPLYRRRQAIVEHPYGTIKRYWGLSYMVTKKGMERAAADVGLMFTAYTLKRIMNILDPAILKTYLKESHRLASLSLTKKRQRELGLNG